MYAKNRNVLIGGTVSFFAVLALLSSASPILAAQTAGAAAFKANCAMCHGPDGSGNTPIGRPAVTGRLNGSGSTTGVAFSGPRRLPRLPCISFASQDYSRGRFCAVEASEAFQL
jgi:hypothetical protein